MVDFGVDVPFWPIVVPAGALVAVFILVAIHIKTTAATAISANPPMIMPPNFRSGFPLVSKFFGPGISLSFCSVSNRRR